jgi:uncharacterized protein (DUF2345 family)
MKKAIAILGTLLLLSTPAWTGPGLQLIAGAGDLDIVAGAGDVDIVAGAGDLDIPCGG